MKTYNHYTMLTPTQKLQIMREMESKLSLGFSVALNFFEQKLKEITDAKQSEFTKVMESMDREIVALKLKVKDGENGKNGVDGKDGKDGANGIDGYTPKKFVDYFTPADIEEISKNVMDRIKPDEEVENDADYITIEYVKKIISESLPKQIAQEEIQKIVESMVSDKIDSKIRSVTRKENKKYMHGAGDSMSGIVRVTTTQRLALTGLLGGEIVYDTTIGAPYIYVGGSWYAIQLAS